MRIPGKLKIGGHLYDVLYPYHFTERGDIKGQHDCDMKQIRLDDKDGYCHEERPESSIAVTFLHEILHACDDLSGHHIFNGEQGEKVIEGISEMLFQILRDNKLRFDEAE